MVGLLCLLLSSVALAERHHIVIADTQLQTQIDGDLSDPLWQHATVVDLTLQNDPGENTPAPVRTTAKVIANAETLYVAFIAEDPDPSRIRAQLTDRDKIWGDDLVGIKLDTWDQARLAYQFFVNPYGVQLDSIENELTGRESEAWDGIWQSAGQITASGYQVEIALPLRLFSFNDRLDEQRWGIELVRFYPRENQYRLSATPVSRNQSCRLCQMGLATGLAGAKPGQQLQLTPSLALSRHESRPTPDDEWRRDDSVEPALDLRWAITPDTLLNATINPDFSQVEADSGQLDVNTTFALYYPEKRPFYLDNADYFETLRNLINTRNLASPEYGTKITGQRGKHLFGLLQTKDEKTNFLVPGNLSSSIAELGQSSDNFAARYLYDSTASWSLGSIASFRSSKDYQNSVVGLDGQWEITAQNKIKALYVRSETRYPDFLRDQFCGGDTPCDQPDKVECSFGDCDYNEQVLRLPVGETLKGDLLRVALYHNSRHLFGYANYERIDEAFRADLGFIDQVDFAKGAIGGGYIWYPQDHFFHKIQLGGDVDRSENIAGEKLEEEIEFSGFVAGRNELFVELYGGLREIAGRRQDASNLALKDNAPMFDETWLGLYGELRPVKPLKFGANIRIGDDIDYANNQLGEVFQINGWVNWKPHASISLNASHIHRTLDVPGGQLFAADLSDLRLHWQFTVRAFIRMTAIYTQLERDPALYRYNRVDRHSERLSAELLYGYKVNPQTVFYLGYGEGQFSDDEFRDLSSDSRTLFAKFSYAWLL
ncbi:DUF5916 domain-containing protein [Ferrimonas pelagia]|uniref:DUF5916 domain-containing protein n=1 Tax=Ferrimonas pelagia TaxID=1177826 RepID=A0ABP9EPG1_9GAMM